MAEQCLDDADIDTVFEQVGAKLWRKVCGPTRLAMSAASAASTTTRYSWRVLIGTIAFRPGKSQPSACMTPCCRPARHHSRSNGSRPAGNIA